MYILAVDPGTHMGWAEFEDTRFPKAFGTVHGEEDIWQFIHCQKGLFDALIVEDYKVRPMGQKGFNHAWNNVFPAQVIGAWKFWASAFHIPVVLQQPSIKAIGAKMAFNRDYKKRSDNHEEDAIIHGVYFLQTVVERGLWKCDS